MRGQPTAPQSPCSGPTDVARGAWPPKSREDCRGGLRSSKVPRWYLDTPKITSRYPSNAMFWDHPRCSRQPRSRRRTLPILPPSPLPATAHLQPLAQPIALRHPGSRCDIDSHPDCRSFLTLIVAPHQHLPPSLCRLPATAQAHRGRGRGPGCEAVKQALPKTTGRATAASRRETFQATDPRPFFATNVRSFSEAPRGRFSPRSHWLTKLAVTLR